MSCVCARDVGVEKLIKMKTIAVTVVATLVLAVCAVDETQRAPADDVNGHGSANSMLTKLRAAVKQIEFLADEVDATLRLTETAGQGDQLPPAREHDSHVNWLPPGIEMFRRDDRRRASGRRRYDTYGVAGRFGRSAN